MVDDGDLMVFDLRSIKLKKKRMQKSLNKNQIIAIITLVCTLQNISLSQIGPFFPIEAANKGVSEQMLGFIIGMNPFFYIGASFLMGKHLQKLGRKRALQLGLMLIVF